MCLTGGTVSLLVWGIGGWVGGAVYEPELRWNRPGPLRLPGLLAE